MTPSTPTPSCAPLPRALSAGGDLATEVVRRYQAFGVWDTGQRWSEYIEADSPAEAEAIALYEAEHEHAKLTIAGIIDVTGLPPDVTDCVDAGGPEGDDDYKREVAEHLAELRADDEHGIGGAADEAVRA